MAGGGSSDPVRTFAAGIIGGVCATVAVHPADTLRTRMQLRSAPFMRHGGGGAALSVLEELRAIMNEGGMRVLFAGAAARIVKRSLSTALTWTLFEQASRRLRA